MENEFGKDRFKDVKPTDALGRLAERSRGSRITLVIVAVVALFAFAFAVNLIIQSVRSGGNAPNVPRVELR